MLLSLPDCDQLFIKTYVQTSRLDSQNSSKFSEFVISPGPHFGMLWTPRDHFWCST